MISLEQRLGNPYLAAAKLACASHSARAERLGSFRPDPLPRFCLAIHVRSNTPRRRLRERDVGTVSHRASAVEGMHFARLAADKSGYAMYPRLDTSGIDVMIAETPYPGRVSTGRSWLCAITTQFRS